MKQKIAKCLVLVSVTLEAEVDVLQKGILPPVQSYQSVELKSGWNLIALPGRADGTFYTSSYFNGHRVFAYQSGQWTENPTIMETGLGYWVHSDSDTWIQYESEGGRHTLVLDTDMAGWNLLGTGTSVNLASELQGLSYIGWSYDNGEFTKNPETISAGQGFWLKID